MSTYMYIYMYIYMYCVDSQFSYDLSVFGTSVF